MTVNEFDQLDRPVDSLPFCWLGSGELDEETAVSIAKATVIIQP